jgi:hypothetical protein
MAMDKMTAWNFIIYNPQIKTNCQGDHIKEHEIVDGFSTPGLGEKRLLHFSLKNGREETILES